jgi:pyrroloquinoline-quinone synthase
VAWANGKLTREHFARWAENHYHYVGPFADYLGYIYSRMRPTRPPTPRTSCCQNMYEEELGGVRHTDLLIRFAEACGTTRERVVDIDNAHRRDPRPAGLVLRDGDARALRRRRRRPGGGSGVAGAVDLPPPVPGADREVRVHRGGGRVLRPAHHESDEIHGERGYQIVLEHATTPELQQRCLKICEIGAQMRLLYTTALYHDYVARELSLAELGMLEASVPSLDRTLVQA